MVTKLHNEFTESWIYNQFTDTIFVTNYRIKFTYEEKICNSVIIMRRWQVFISVLQARIWIQGQYLVSKWSWTTNQELSPNSLASLYSFVRGPNPDVRALDLGLCSVNDYIKITIKELFILDCFECWFPVHDFPVQQKTYHHTEEKRLAYSEFLRSFRTVLEFYLIRTL